MLTLAFAQGAQTAPPETTAANPLIGLMPIAVIFIIFYFLLIRPQKRQQQEHSKMLTELEKNDEVVTAGGIYGTIVNIDKQSDIVTIRIDDNTRIKVQKNSIARLKKPKVEERQ